MLKIRKVVFPLLTLLFWIPGAWAQSADSREYKVVKGDTLWDISQAQLNDPFLWSDIWKANPQINNPNLIYPDQNIKIPPIADTEKTDESEPIAPSPEETKTPAATVAENPQTASGETECPEGRTSCRAPEESSVKAGPRYPNLKGVELYDGTAVYGEITFLSAEIVTLRTPDDQEVSYSVARDVANFIKE